MASTIEKARLFNTGAQTANSDLFNSDVDPTYSGSNLRVSISVQGSAILNVQEDNGSNTVSYDLNGGNSLDADELYVFDVPTRESSTYNFQLESSVAINVLNVDEVKDSEV